MLFESLCKVCISMFSPLILQKISDFLKSHAHHIYVAYETVELSSCRTSVGSLLNEELTLKMSHTSEFLSISYI